MRNEKPHDDRIAMLYDDLVSLDIDNAADFAFRVSQSMFRPITASSQFPDLGDCLASLDQSGVAFWVTGGWVSDFHLGRVLRDHDDLDLFVLDGVAESLFGFLDRSPDFDVRSQNDEHRQQSHHEVRYRDCVTIDLATVVVDGPLGSIWDGQFAFRTSEFEARRRAIAMHRREVTASVISPELHYLLKLAGFRHFGIEVREKDFADVRAILPLIDRGRLAEARIHWRDRLPIDEEVSAN